MKRPAKSQAASSRRRITICLPQDLDDAIRAEAGASPNGELTPIILRHIRRGTSPGRGSKITSDLRSGVVLLGVALDLVREAGAGDIEKLETARQLYGLLLEMVIDIEGVGA